MEKCMICKIVAKKAPSWVVYEDKYCICFLPLHMEVFGHTLISPKKHYKDLLELPDETLLQIMKTIKKIANIYETKLKATGFNLLLANGKDAQQHAPHVHFHLLPRYKNEKINAWPRLRRIEINKDEFIKKIL